MTGQLFFQAVTKFFAGVILVGLMIFWPAGTFFYPNGWLLMGILFVPMVLAGLVMMVRNPELLKKRLQGKETQKEQQLVVRLSGLMFLLGFVVSGLGFRLGWYSLPKWAVYCAVVVFLVAYGLYAEVLRENIWLSRTIAVQAGQKVIDAGLYGIVRHPMYSATVLLFLSMPLILGSVFGFLIFLAYPLIIAKRIQNEEEVLKNQLQGYDAYIKKVRYRLIPYIW